jgi:hypothetical protein
VLYLWIYLTGVVAALAVMRDPWPARVTTALVWPLGPVAFLVVIVIQLGAALYLWPIPALAGIGAIAALFWATAC